MSTTTDDKTETTESAKQEVVPAASAATALPDTITPMGMLHIAVQQGADLDKLERLMALNEKWEANEARKAFEVAYAKFKGETLDIIKDTQGHNSKYAELAQVCAEVGPALSKYGLSHSWRFEELDKGGIRVFCTITHELGHSKETFMSGMPDTSGNKNEIQAKASTISYLERYTLMAVCGVSARGMDDDGGEARKRDPNAPDRPRRETRKPTEAEEAAQAEKNARALDEQYAGTVGPSEDAQGASKSEPEAGPKRVTLYIPDKDPEHYESPSEYFSALTSAVTLDPDVWFDTRNQQVVDQFVDADPDKYGPQKEVVEAALDKPTTRAG